MMARSLKFEHVGQVLRHRKTLYTITGVQQMPSHTLLTVSRGTRTGLPLALDPNELVEVTQ